MITTSTTMFQNPQNKYWQGSKGGMIFIHIIVKYSIVYYSKSCLPPLDFFFHLKMYHVHKFNLIDEINTMCIDHNTFCIYCNHGNVNIVISIYMQGRRRWRWRFWRWHVCGIIIQSPKQHNRKIIVHDSMVNAFHLNNYICLIVANKWEIQNISKWMRWFFQVVWHCDSLFFFSLSSFQFHGFIPIANQVV